MDLFQAGDDPRLNEKLAEAGREGCSERDVGAWVSQAQMAAAYGALGSVVRVMVRGVCGNL